jgi:Xaa-Pro dipeptidase
MEPSQFTEQEFNQRQSALLKKLVEINYSIIFSRPDLYYYSSIGMDGIITVDNELTRYIRRNLDLAQAESVIPVKEMENFRLFKSLSENFQGGTLGLELDILPYKTVTYIQKAFNNPKIIDISPYLREIRSVKSKKEIEMMQKSCEITDRSFEYANELLKPGKSELEISADIENFLRREGHPGWVQVRMFHHNLTNLAFVMAGESTAVLNSKFGPVSGQGVSRMHTNGASRRKIKDNEAVLIDTTGDYHGYISDVTRTFMLGKVDTKIIDTYQVAIEVHEKSRGMLKEGNLPNEIYSELQEFVKEFGYIDNFMGIHSDKVEFIGHGIGLELDEFPIITPSYTQPLESGNIIAMEPKLILNNPKTGVGIEEDWLVTESGGIRLSKYPLNNLV